MALETLKDVKEIGGFKVGHVGIESKEEIQRFDSLLGEAREAALDRMRSLRDNPIVVYHLQNAITFQIQDGPIKEEGVNGCQVDTIIETAKIMLEGLNEKIPCEENKQTISHLKTVLFWLEQRTANRKRRGVEGTSKA